MVSALLQLWWLPPARLFAKETITEVPSVFTDGGKRVSVAIIYYSTGNKSFIIRFREFPHHFSQYKEICVVYSAFKEANGPFNLFLDRVICSYFASLAIKMLWFKWRKHPHWLELVYRRVHSLCWASKSIPFMFAYKYKRDLMSLSPCLYLSTSEDNKKTLLLWSYHY